MVRIELKIKQEIIELKNKNHTRKDIAIKFGKSERTIGRVFDEYKNGVFKTNEDGHGEYSSTIKRLQDRIDSNKKTPPTDMLETMFDMALPSKDSKKTKVQKNRLTCFGSPLTVLLEKTNSGEVTEVTEVAEVEEVTEVAEVAEVTEVMDYVHTHMNMVFTYGGKSYIADKSTKYYGDIVSAVLSGDAKQAIKLYNLPDAVVTYFHGEISIENGVAYYKNIRIESGMTQRILDAFDSGDHKQARKLCNFFEKLMQNPSKSAVDELFLFLVASDIEILDNGNFVAYKKVNDDYTDIRTGKFDNSIGSTPRMLRNQVDENSSVTCSTGLHVCSKSYLSHYSGSRVVLCEVHPKDVVSIPTDYANSKMRTEGYKVIGDVTDTIKY